MSIDKTSEHVLSTIPLDRLEREVEKRRLEKRVFDGANVPIAGTTNGTRFAYKNPNGATAVILAVQTHQLQPRRVLLEGQIYADTLAKLLTEPGVEKIIAIPVRSGEYVELWDAALERARKSS